MNFDRIWTLLARKLAGETSPEELGELESLLKQNPDTHLKVQALVESWNRQEESVQADTGEAYLDIVSKLKVEGQMVSTEEYAYSFDEGNGTQKRFRKKLILFASVLMVIISAGVLLFTQNKSSSPASTPAVATNNSVSTLRGSRSTKMELPDGTKVWLNAGSKFTYDKDFGNSLREVYLTGEAFFEVVHNADKPFIIHTPIFDIKDLGTQFNVKCYPEDKTTETSLIEGSVEISVRKKPKDNWILRKTNHKIILLNEDFLADDKKVVPVKVDHLPKKSIMQEQRLTFLPEDSFSVETAWTHNKLSFDDEEFGEVAKKMGRWYDCEFFFANEKMKGLPVHASFDTETLEKAMEALKYTFRIKYEIKDNKVTIY